MHRCSHVCLCGHRWVRVRVQASPCVWVCIVFFQARVGRNKSLLSQRRAKEQGGPASFSVPGSSVTEDANRKMWWISHSFPKDRFRQDCVRKEGQASHGGEPSQLYRNSFCPKRGGSRWHRRSVLIQHEVTESSTNQSPLDFSTQLVCGPGLSSVCTFGGWQESFGRASHSPRASDVHSWYYPQMRLHVQSER